MFDEIDEVKSKIRDVEEDIERADDSGVSSYHLRQKLLKLRETLAQLEEKYEKDGDQERAKAGA